MIARSYRPDTPVVDGSRRLTAKNHNCKRPDIRVPTNDDSSLSPPQSSRPQRAVVAVVSRRDRFLVIRRSQSVIAPGAYCFPGGGIDAGETQAQAVVREMHEELGVETLPRRRLWQSVSPWNVQLAWWFVDIPDDAVLQANAAEVAEVHWLTSRETRSLDGLLESNHAFFDALHGGEFSLPLR